MGYDEEQPHRSSPPRSTCSRSTASGPSRSPQWGTIEGQAEAQAARAYSGEITAEEAVSNIEQIVQQEVFG